MNKQLELELVKKYPLIFKDYGGDPQVTTMCFGMECGSGWFWILEALCGNIQNAYENAVRQREYAIQNQTGESPEDTDGIVCPSAAQIKEKFGTLRFYTNDDMTGWAKDTESFISMAESMSARTCENCGCPAMVSHGGWSRCECSECSLMRLGKEWEAYRKRESDFVEEAFACLVLAMTEDRAKEELF